MGLRITQHGRAVQRNIDKTTSRLEGSMRKLSSGKRITRTSDDPAASQIAESFTTQIKGSTRAARNAYDAANLARMSEASLGSIANILHKVRELAV